MKRRIWKVKYRFIYDKSMYDNTETFIATDNMDIENVIVELKNTLPGDVKLDIAYSIIYIGRLQNCDEKQVTKQVK